MTTSTEVKPAAQLFSLKTPMLSEGRMDNHVAQTDLMKVTVKVYAAGGENAMHMHPHEDHAFIVLQGQATFHLETDDNIKVLNKNDGVMLPKGTSYWFLSSAGKTSSCCALARPRSARKTGAPSPMAGRSWACPRRTSASNRWSCRGSFFRCRWIVIPAHYRK